MPALRKTPIEKAEAALAAEQARLEQVTGELAGLSARRGDLAEDQAAFARNEQTIRDLEAEQRRLGIVIARREGDPEQARRDAAETVWGAARKALEEASVRTAEASKPIAALIADLSAAVTDLEDARQAEKVARKAYRDAAPTHVEGWEYPTCRDEHGWPRFEQHVIELLARGPNQPAVAARKGAEERERARQPNPFDVAVERILAGDDETEVLSGLWPEQLRHDVAVRAAAHRKAEAQRQAVAERKRRKGRFQPATSDGMVIVARDLIS